LKIPRGLMDDGANLRASPPTFRQRGFAAMPGKNKEPLEARVVRAAEAALAAQGYAGAIDMLLGIGWLPPSVVEEWRRGQIDCLERAIQTNPARIAQALTLLRAWAAAKDLKASETDYVARRPERPTLRFSASGDPAIDSQYRTHWVSPALSTRKRERLAEKASRAPELVVVKPLNNEWTCHRCGKTGDLLMMENPGPACLACVGLDDLTFLPAGDALLTRRAKANSTRSAVVVRFSRTRRRYERQGLLVEPAALAHARGDAAVG
jgi:hypothetical protein